jgi:hypothetical protein
MFAAEFEPALRDYRRRAARAPVSLDASPDEEGPGGLARALCKVIEVSIHGCKLQTYSALRRGAAIWLNLPGLGRVTADVIWADDFAAGCQFHAPLEQLAVDALAARHN